MVILKLLFVYAAIGVILWFLIVLAMSIVTSPIFPDSKDRRETLETMDFIASAPTYAKTKAFVEFTISLILFWPIIIYEFAHKKNNKEDK